MAHLSSSSCTGPQVVTLDTGHRGATLPLQQCPVSVLRFEFVLKLPLLPLVLSHWAGWNHAALLVFPSTFPLHLGPPCCSVLLMHVWGPNDRVGALGGFFQQVVLWCTFPSWGISAPACV